MSARETAISISVFTLVGTAAMAQMSFETPSIWVSALSLFFLQLLISALPAPLSSFSTTSIFKRYFQVASAFGLLYFSVQLGIWNGFYVDFNVARILLYSTTLGVGGVFALSKLFKQKPNLADTMFRALLSSAVVSMSLLIIRMHSSPVRLDLLTTTWIFVSVFAIHFIYAAQWFTLVRKWRWLLPVQLVLALQTLILFSVALMIDETYPYSDRAAGVFALPAPHLELASFARTFTPRNTTHTLRILNLNAWVVENWIPSFIATASKDVDLRMSLLPQAIDSLDADVVIFEELWTAKRRHQISERLKELGYLYSVEGSESLANILGIGNGLLVVSKRPLDPKFESITYSTVTRFDENFPFVRKGAIKTKLQLPDGRWIDVYATHLGASDTVLESGQATEFSADHINGQKKQVAELMQFIAKTRTSRSMILGADLNTTPQKFEHGQFTGDLTEVYASLTCAGNHAAGCLDLKDPSAGLNLKTYDSKTNPYVSGGYFPYEPAGQIDYLLNSGGDIRPIKVSLVFTDVPLSDHYGLLTTYEIAPNSTAF